MKFYYYNERMIAKYVLLIGLFHRVYSNYNSFGIMRTYFLPYESTPPKVNVLQTQKSIDNLFGVMNDARLMIQQTSIPQPSYVRLINSQPSNKQIINLQVSNPQTINSQLSNSQRSYPQISNPQRSYSQINNSQRSYSQMNNPHQSILQQRKPQSFKTNFEWNNETVDKKIVQTEPFGNNNNNIVFGPSKVPQQQVKIKQTLKQEATERLKQQQQAMEKLQQQTVERLRQKAVEKLKEQTINNLKEQQAHLFNLMESVTKKRQENQKRNLEVWQRIVKQRNKHMQRRFYDHVLHDDDDDDDDDDDND